MNNKTGDLKQPFSNTADVLLCAVLSSRRSQGKTQTKNLKAFWLM